ncbi:MAG: acyl-CoA thioesterase [Nocardiaceae bacterium]|nr:acyl-CoA thioesterase [Nocardiaceae bacterium]
MSRFVYSCPLRWSDMDSDGHVHDAVHLRYLEETRIGLFRELGFSGASVVAQLDIDYLVPLRYRPEPVRSETWVSRIGGSSFDLNHEILDDETTYSAVKCTIVAFDSEAQRSRPLTDAERAGLGKLGMH